MLESLHNELDLVRGIKPPSTWEKDPESLEEAWIRARLRERSVINHLFHGMQTSCVKCKSCGYESNSHSEFRELVVTFDTKDRVILVKMVRQAPAAAPNLTPYALNRTYALSTNPLSTILVLKTLLSQHSKVPVDRIWMCMIGRGRIAKELKNSDYISDIGERDEIVAFELGPDSAYHVLIYHLVKGRTQGLPCMVAVGKSRIEVSVESTTSVMAMTGAEV